MSRNAGWTAGECCASFSSLIDVLARHLLAIVSPYAARNENFVLVPGELHNGLGAPGARPPERSGAFGVPASDGDGGSGGAKPPGLKKEPDMATTIGKFSLWSTAAIIAIVVLALAIILSR